MLFGGAFVLHSMPTLFASKIKSNLPILRGTDAFKRYTTSTVPLQVKVYLFNVTNPLEVAKGAKPKLAQAGPYSLTERRHKEVLGFSPNNHTLDYRLHRTYYFQPNESAPLDAMLTLPNVGAISGLFKARWKAREDDDKTPINVIAGYLTNETLYITDKAENWLFNGIKMKYLDLMDADAVPMEEKVPNNSFGIYYMKNDTWDEQADGTMTVSTGADGNFTNIGQVVRWNGKPKVNYWKGTCNEIRGTDGQFFHPFIQKEDKLRIFAPDLCRSLAIEFIKTTSIRSIELYRFGISSDFFRPIDYNEETACYCVKKSFEAKKKFCKLGGVVDVSSCRRKPIVLSTPHFYNGDPILRDAVEGLAPSAANHDTFIDIEPMTGAVLRVRRRLQVNVEIEPSQEDEWAAADGLRTNIIHPFVWLDQSITIPDELAQKLENKLTKIVRLVRILSYAAMITGPIILLATLGFILRDIRTEDKKIRSASSSSSGGASGSKKNHGDYQKVQVIMKPLNSGDTTQTG